MNGVKTIESTGFRLVGKNAKTIQLPDSLITISSLPSTVSEVSFGSQIKTLPALNTETITKVTISEANLNFTVEGNCIYDRNRTTLKKVWGQPTSISILNGVQTIGGSAIYGQTKLITIHLPDSVETIDGSAFGKCTSLVTIHLPDSVETINGSAFDTCTSLASIYLGSRLKKIGSTVFTNCSSLSSIEIPSSIESIDANAFGSWPQARTIRIHKPKDSISGMPWGANIGDRAIIWDE